MTEKLTPRIVEAFRVRDIALSLLERYGTSKRTGIGYVRTWKCPDLRLLYSTPFQKLADFTEDQKQRALVIGIPLPRVLPYELSIWDIDTHYTYKVFLLRWSDSDDFELRRFNYGEWERVLHRCATGGGN